MSIYGGFQLGDFQSDFQTSVYVVGRYVVDPEFLDPCMRDFRTFRFPVVSPAEEHVLTWDFSSELLSGETLAGFPTITVEVTAGVDPNSGTYWQGQPSLNAALTQVSVPWMGGLDNCDYYISVDAPTSTPYKVLGRYSLLSVRI